jgi:hypothetical protein
MLVIYLAKKDVYVVGGVGDYRKLRDKNLSKKDLVSSVNLYLLVLSFLY